MAMKDYDKAVDSYSAAIRFEPGAAPVYRNRSRAYEAATRLNEALDDLIQVGKLAPDDKEVGPDQVRLADMIDRQKFAPPREGQRESDEAAARKLAQAEAERKAADDAAARRRAQAEQQAADEAAARKFAQAEAERRAAEERAKLIQFGVHGLAIIVLGGGAFVWFRRRKTAA
jgi:tetratricopeptide (TPR) repeat protein